MTEPFIEIDAEPIKRELKEKDIENAVKRIARYSFGMLAEKFTSPGRRSVPDDIFTTENGVMFFIEFKAPGKKPTKKQDEDHKRRRAMGCWVFVVDNIEQGQRVLATMDKVKIVTTKVE